MKHNPNGSISKYKAILAAKGFHEKEGFDFFETFSPIVKPTSEKLILVFALSQGWIIRQCDFNNEIFNGDLVEEFFMV